MYHCVLYIFFFFFKQKTAYEMRISDWSSDVCSSDLQAASWDKPRRVIAKIEWHPGELFPKVGFIVTNLPMEPDWVVRFYNQRGTAEQHIKEGKYAFRWTRLSCRKFRHNEVRLQLHALAYNLATFLRCIELPEAMADWSLTSLQLKLIKIGARVVRHARAITFQLAEVAVTGPMVRAALRSEEHMSELQSLMRITYD